MTMTHFNWKDNLHRNYFLDGEFAGEFENQTHQENHQKK